jgi:hypothetical protein
MDIYDIVFLAFVFRELCGSTLDRVMGVMLLVLDALSFF